MITRNQAFALTTNQAFELAHQQVLVNEEIVHQKIQEEIPKDAITSGTIDLIQETQLLKRALDDVSMKKNEKTMCPEESVFKNEDPPRNNRKIKTKKKTEGEWVIGAILEIQDDGNYERFSLLQSPHSKIHYNHLYEEWLNMDSFSELQELIRQQTQNMTKEEYLSYLAEMTSRLGYNDNKAQFKQDGDTQKADSLWSMIEEAKKVYTHTGSLAEDGTWGGVCGDIHFATVVIGETARADQYEYFTTSYVVSGMQHVHAFAIDKETGQAIVTNYKTTQITDYVDGVESISVRYDGNEGGFNNIGNNMRIYANSAGSAKHIATLKSAIGSFIYASSTDQSERIGTPLYNDFNTQGIDINKRKTVTEKMEKEKYDDEGNVIVSDKEKTVEISSGLKVLHGSRSNGLIGNTEIFTLAYYRQADSNTNGYGSVIDSKKIGQENHLNISGNLAQVGNMNLNQRVYVMQVNYTQGLYKTIYRNDNVDIQANARFNINGDFIPNHMTGDGNLETSYGLSSNMRVSDNDQLYVYANHDQAIGVREERELYDFKNLPSNVMLTSNAVRAGLIYQHSLQDTKLLSLNSSYTGTQVGGLFNISSSYQDGKRYVFINYQNNAPGINRHITSNLIPNNGERLTVGTGFRDLNFWNMTADFNSSITYMPTFDNKYFIGAGLKVNVNSSNTNSKKKTKKKTMYP